MALEGRFQCLVGRDARVHRFLFWRCTSVRVRILASVVQARLEPFEDTPSALLGAGERVRQEHEGGARFLDEPERNAPEHADRSIERGVILRFRMVGVEILAEHTRRDI